MPKSSSKRKISKTNKKDLSFWVKPTPQDSDKVYDRIVAGQAVKLHVNSSTIVDYVNAQRQFLVNVYPDLPVATMPIDKLELLIRDFGAFVQDLEEK